jgi:hypothetical protein
MNGPPLYGLMIECTEPDQVLLATRRAWEAGYRKMDAYTPYPVEGLATALGMSHSRIPAIVLCGGLIGAAVGFAMQYYSMVIDYPLNVGGRPLNSWPAFITVAFEMLVLVASLSALLGMLYMNGLPRPNHPVFNAPGFERASQDRFFLCIEATDPRFDAEETARFLVGLAPTRSLIEVFHEQMDEPEVLDDEARPALVPEPQMPVAQSGGRES